MTDQPLVRGVTYYYTVTSVDQRANESAPIPEVVAFSIPPAIVSVTALYGTVTGAGLHDLNSTTTLNVIPNPGYVFTQWSGDIAGVQNPLPVVMDGDKNVIANFVPEAVDTDGDSMPDEIDPDNDGDGTPDETDAFPLDPVETTDTDHDCTGNSADLDDDGDGFDDQFEAANGFDPTDADSTPDALSSIRTAVEFRFNAANGVSYRIEASSDLIDWSVIETDIIGQSAVIARFYSIENQPMRYFRVRRN